MATGHSFGDVILDVELHDAGCPTWELSDGMLENVQWYFKFPQGVQKVLVFLFLRGLSRWETGVTG